MDGDRRQHPYVLGKKKKKSLARGAAARSAAAAAAPGGSELHGVAGVAYNFEYMKLQKVRATQARFISCVSQCQKTDAHDAPESFEVKTRPGDATPTSLMPSLEEASQAQVSPLSTDRHTLPGVPAKPSPRSAATTQAPLSDTATLAQLRSVAAAVQLAPKLCDTSFLHQRRICSENVNVDDLITNCQVMALASLASLASLAALAAASPLPSAATAENVRPDDEGGWLHYPDAYVQACPLYSCTPSVWRRRRQGCSSRSTRQLRQSRRP
jgi:hypothetical protein